MRNRLLKDQPSEYMAVMIMRSDSFSKHLKIDNVSTHFTLEGDRVCVS